MFAVVEELYFGLIEIDRLTRPKIQKIIATEWRHILTKLPLLTRNCDAFASGDPFVAHQTNTVFAVENWFDEDDRFLPAIGEARDYLQRKIECGIVRFRMQRDDQRFFRR